jgi:hypothetical protein
MIKACLLKLSLDKKILDQLNLKSKTPNYYCLGNFAVTASNSALMKGIEIPYCKPRVFQYERDALNFIVCDQTHTMKFTGIKKT